MVTNHSLTQHCIVPVKPLILQQYSLTQLITVLARSGKSLSSKRGVSPSMYSVGPPLCLGEQMSLPRSQHRSAIQDLFDGNRAKFCRSIGWNILAANGWLDKGKKPSFPKIVERRGQS